MTFLLRRNLPISPPTLAARFLATRAAEEYDDLIASAALSGDFDAVRHLLTKRVTENCANTSKTFSFISAATSPPDLLHRLSQTLPQIETRPARKAAYDSLIATLCKLRRVPDALNLLDAAARGECGVKASTFHPVLDALTRKRDVKGAWRLIESMGGYGVAPDRTAYNYLLSACCGGGDLEEAARVVAEMREAGVGWDPLTYDSLVMGTCRAGRVGGAMMLLRRMEEDGVLVLYSTHAHVIGAMVRLGCYAQAVEYVMVYAGRDKSKRVDLENFGLLAHRLIKKNRFTEADFVLTQMKRRELAINGKLKDYLQNSKLTSQSPKIFVGEAMRSQFRLIDPLDSPEPTRSFFLHHAGEVQALLSIGPSPVRSETLSLLPKLELVVGSSTGLDHVDLPKCWRRGIAVTNADPAFSEDVADYAGGLLLDVLRRISASD